MSGTKSFYYQNLVGDLGEKLHFPFSEDYLAMWAFGLILHRVNIYMYILFRMFRLSQQRWSWLIHTFMCRDEKCLLFFLFPGFYLIVCFILWVSDYFCVTLVIFPLYAKHCHIYRQFNFSFRYLK